VDDLIEGLIRMMNSPEGFTGPINIGNPQEFTILQLAETLIRMTGSASPIIFRPLPQDDPIQRRPDIALAREKLGWEPRIPLSEGLEKTIAYFRKVIENDFAAA
jgi:UDP-glucuronate decarboxylase